MSRKKVRLNGSILMVSGHLETIYPAVFRWVSLNNFERRTIQTPDDDFLELDVLKGNKNKVVILCHGLEGNSRRPYMKGMAKILNASGYSIISWNYRGCAGMNRQKIFYHSGATYDLNTVVRYALECGYEEINLVGFSLGGNLILKYLGEDVYEEAKAVNKAVAISVPFDLKDCCEHILKRKNKLYHDRFLYNLKTKVRKKAIKGFDYDLERLSGIKNLYDFDEYFTAPIHGFSGAEDYYRKCSSIYFLEGITTSTLVINARNDSFFSVPKEDFLRDHPFIDFELTNRGGHVGFPSILGLGFYEAEKRTREWLDL